MWILFSFLTASFETVRDIFGKKSSQQTNEYVAAFGIQFFSLLVILPALWWGGIPEIKPVFWWATLGGLLTVPIGNILYMKAVKSSDISLVVPMLAFNPFFTAIIAAFFSHQFPSALGWIGILVVGVGLYTLRLNTRLTRKNIFLPFAQLKTDAGAKAMLGVALVWSVGANLGKVLVANSSPMFAAFMGASTSSVVLFFILAVQFKWQMKLIVKSVRSGLKNLSILGMGVGLSNLAMYAALSTGFTPYVIAIKRSNIVFSSVLSKFLFGEKLTKNKVFGILTMFVGLVLIIVG